ncbi:MAG: AraC family transcriptional regulator [Bacteroides sp.]|nr:AraC family transcriptional regulator [Eubacterium sp.]MCM1417874.1 AraC family transcriptional regulator [Roseburia sp.]MCM1461313.1 AraC family transcriptional regulator [Bacteroides sp.]
MKKMKLAWFTTDGSFPFFIQNGAHEGIMFTHEHEDFHELVIVRGGTAEHLVDGELSVVKAGDVFRIGEGVAHGYRNARGLKIFNVMYRPSYFFGEGCDLGGSKGFRRLFTDEPYGSMTLGLKELSAAERLAERAIDEYNAAAPGRKTALTACFLELTVVLSRAAELPERRKEILGVEAAAAYIDDHYPENVSIAQVAELSNYSQRHFIRLFSAVYGKTPQQYLMDTRIRHSRSLLKRTNLSVTEIAIRCGFSDANYFSRIFRRATGSTPNGYRKNGTELPP